MIKTHFPFMGPEFDETQECVSKIIMTVRHPIDNYIAWIAYKGFIKGEIHALKSRRRMKFPMFWSFGSCITTIGMHMLILMIYHCYNSGMKIYALIQNG